MSKKNKKNLQKLLEKKRALQEISASATVVPSKAKPVVRPTTFNAPSFTSHLPQEAITQMAVEPELASQIPTHHSKEIIRTLISVLIIAILMTGAIITDRKSPDFTNFGNWLYRTR